VALSFAPNCPGISMFGYFESKVNELYNVVAPQQSEEDQFLTAIANGELATVQGFMGRGYGPEWRNKNGNTALHVACYNGQVALVDYLIEQGGDPTATGQRNNTCLHYAAAKGNLDLVKKFISFGISPLAKNEHGKTPYDVAEGFGVKQYLMPLMFSEEQKTGTAPSIPGATVDLAVEAQRLENLPPPPKMGEHQQQPGRSLTPNPSSQGSSHPSTPHRKSTPPPSLHGALKERKSAARMYQPDGFVTTVGNPELAAKYGNTSSYQNSSSPTNTTDQISSGPLPPPTYNPNLARNSPFSQGRYVSYNAASNSGGPPVMYNNSGGAGASGAYSAAMLPQQGSSSINVFTPQAHANAASVYHQAPNFHKSERQQQQQQSQQGYGQPLQHSQVSHAAPSTSFQQPTGPPPDAPQQQGVFQISTSESPSTSRSLAPHEIASQGAPQQSFRKQETQHQQQSAREDHPASAVLQQTSEMMANLNVTPPTGDSMPALPSNEESEEDSFT